MIPYTVLLFVFVLVIIPVLYLSSSDKRIRRITQKKSNFVRSLVMMHGDQNVDKTILALAKDFHYTLEHIDAERGQYVLSDRVSFFSWGFFYLIEFNDGKLEIYLKPRFPLEINKFGLFERRLRRMTELIPLIESSLVKG